METSPFTPAFYRGVFPIRYKVLSCSVLGAVVATIPGAAFAASTTCTTSVVCAEYINSSSGVAIHGEANSGIGVRGTSVTNTGFYGASGSGKMFTPGVEGESTNNNGSDTAGGFGLSWRANEKGPQVGLLTYGGLYGLGGGVQTAGPSASNPGIGVFGYDEVNQGVANTVGVAGQSLGNTGVLGESGGSPSEYNLFEHYPIGVYAVGNTLFGAPPNSLAIGIVGESNAYPLYAVNSVSSMGVALATPDYLIVTYKTAGASMTALSVDNAGNEMLSGSLTTSSGTYVKTRGGSGASRMAYGSRSTAPEIEDVGEGQLVNGRAVVAIDAALGDSIDMRRSYHVFLTPEGECNGLYVTQKSPGSFVVRELHGGRNSLAFDYRIVAKPLDENGERLAVAPPDHVPTLFPRAGHTNRTLLATPDQRMRANLGEAAYAKSLADLRARLAGH